MLTHEGYELIGARTGSLLEQFVNIEMHGCTAETE